MKKFLSIIMAAMLVFALAGCSKVPEEKLNEVRSKHAELEAVTARYGEILDDLRDIGNEMGMPGLVTYEMEAVHKELKSNMEYNKEVIENDLEKMKEEQVDESIALLDEDLAEANEVMPILERLVNAMRTFKDRVVEVAEKEAEVVGLWNELDWISEETQAIVNEYNDLNDAAAEEIDKVITAAGDDLDKIVDAYAPAEKLLGGLSEKLDEVIAALEGEKAAA